MVKRLNSDLLLFLRQKVMYINIYCTGFCFGEKKRKKKISIHQKCV